MLSAKVKRECILHYPFPVKLWLCAETNTVDAIYWHKFNKSICIDVIKMPKYLSSGYSVFVVSTLDDFLLHMAAFGFDRTKDGLYNVYQFYHKDFATGKVHDLKNICIEGMNLYDARDREEMRSYYNIFRMPELKNDEIIALWDIGNSEFKFDQFERNFDSVKYLMRQLKHTFRFMAVGDANDAARQSLLYCHHMHQIIVPAKWAPGVTVGVAGPEEPIRMVTDNAMKLEKDLPDKEPSKVFDDYSLKSVHPKDIEETVCLLMCLNAMNKEHKQSPTAYRVPAVNFEFENCSPSNKRKNHMRFVPRYIHMYNILQDFLRDVASNPDAYKAPKKSFAFETTTVEVFPTDVEDAVLQEALRGHFDKMAPKPTVETVTPGPQTVGSILKRKLPAVTNDGRCRYKLNKDDLMERINALNIGRTSKDEVQTVFKGREQNNKNDRMVKITAVDGGRSAKFELERVFNKKETTSDEDSTDEIVAKIYALNTGKSVKHEVKRLFNRGGPDNDGGSRHKFNTDDSMVKITAVDGGRSEKFEAERVFNKNEPDNKAPVLPPRKYAPAAEIAVPEESTGTKPKASAYKNNTLLFSNSTRVYDVTQPDSHPQSDGSITPTFQNFSNSPNSTNSPNSPNSSNYDLHSQLDDEEMFFVSDYDSADEGKPTNIM